MITAAGRCGRICASRWLIAPCPSSSARLAESTPAGAPFTTTTTFPCSDRPAKSSRFGLASVNPYPTNTISPSAIRFVGGTPAPRLSSGTISVPIFTDRMTPPSSTAMRVSGPNTSFCIGTRCANPLSPAGSRPSCVKRSTRKRIARVASSVPVSRPCIESCANAYRSRRSSSAVTAPIAGAAAAGVGTVRGGAAQPIPRVSRATTARRMAELHSRENSGRPSGRGA